MEIIISNGEFNDLKSEIKCLIDVQTSINKCNDDKIKLDLTHVNFIHPTSIISLASTIDILKKNGIGVEIESKGVVSGYLKTIDFPDGNAFTSLGILKQFIFKYKSKGYIPLIHFPTAPDLESQKIRDEILNNIRQILVRKLNLNQDYNNGIAYLLSELVENIVEHAGAQKGWIFVQYNPTNQFIEIALLDRGKTIFNSFLDREYRNITSHTMAIEEAIKGLSSKDRNERGYGIPTSLKMTRYGLNGNFTLISGGGI